MYWKNYKMYKKTVTFDDFGAKWCSPIFWTHLLLFTLYRDNTS